jgi:4'-phosphopantetheinyl transferase
MTSSWLSRGHLTVPMARHWLSGYERQRLEGMRHPKPRAEYVLRRWTAKSAVAVELGMPLEYATLCNIEVRTAPSGAPDLFINGVRPGLEISLTDRAGWAVCLMSETSGRLGCDLELLEPRSPGLVRDCFTERERHLVHQSPDGLKLVAPPIWSAKESALKVLRTGLRRSPRTVDVALTDETPSQGWSPLVVWLDEGGRFSGWWRRYGCFVLTAVSERPMPPPRPLEEEPALALAQSCKAGEAPT